MTRIGGVAVAVALLVFGCGPSSSGSPSGSVGMVDAEGSWVLTTGTIDGDPVPVVDGSAPTMTVSGSRVVGTAACNQYGTRIVVVNGVTRFEAFGSTAMACEEPLMASETAFRTAMERVRGAARDGDALVLSGDGVELRFAPLDDVATEEFVDRAWRLVALVEDGVERPPDGDIATVIYRSDGTLEGSTGARTFIGRWTVFDAGIRATEMSMDGPDPPAALAAQDGQVTEVVGNNTPSVDGDRLRLQGRFGFGLVYEAGT